MASNDLELALRIRAAFEGQQALVNLGTSFVEINKKVENLQRGLQALTGSAEGALKEFEYLEEVSKKFGLSIIDLADNYVKLSASARETNLEGEATKKIFESVASTMAVLGGDTITTERAFRALGQMMSKGQIYAEELKGQLAEAIPGAIQIMSRSLGVGTQDLLQLMEAGQLGADVLLPFAQQLEKEYGSLAASTTTFTQAINRIQTEWTLLAKQIGDTGAFNALSKVLELVGKNAEVMAGAVGSLATVGLVMLGKGLVSAVTGLTSYATATRFAANATQQAAVATVASAEADLVAANAANTHTTSILNAATARELSTRGTTLHASALRELTIAQAQATIASNNHIAATKGVVVAQNALIASQGVLSKAWALLTGPVGLIALIIGSFVAMTLAFRGQDEATKILSKSTEEYTKEVENLTAAQLALLDAKAKEAVDDTTKRIQNIKNEIDYLNKRIEVEKQGGIFYESRKGSIYGITNALLVWKSTEELLTQAQSDLDEETNKLSISEGKQALAVNALAAKYYELVEAEKTHSKTIADTNTDINEQKKSIESARTTMYGMINAYGTWSTEAANARANVGKATEGLIALQAKQINQGVVLKNTQDQSNKAIDAYVKATGASREAVLAGLSGSEQAINQLSLQEQAIARNVKESVRLIKEEERLSAQYKQTKAELEAYTRSVTANVEAKVKIAQADGDLAALRDAEINKAKVLEELSARELKVNEEQLAILQNRMDNEKLQLTLNAKGAADTQKRIDKLSLEITAQQGIIDQKKADVAATKAQSDAVERANTLIGSALVQQQQAIITTQNELAELQATYDRLSSSGESITILNGLLEQMRKKQAEVAKQTETMRADMIAAFAAVGLNYEEVMTGMDFETRRQIDAFWALSQQASLSSKYIKEAFSDVLSQADTVTELEALRRKLIELGNNGKLTGEEVSAGLLQIRQRAQALAVDPAFTALQTVLADLREETERGIEIGNLERESLQNRIQSTLEFANARGQEAEAAHLSALAAKEGVEQSILSIQQLQRQQNEIDAHIQMIYAQANADGVYTDAERQVIEALQDQSSAIGQNIQQIEARIPLQQREADQAERLAGALGALIRLYNEQSAAHQRDAEVSERYVDVRLREIDGLIRVAEAQGDETEAARLKEEQQEALIEQAELMASHRAQEAEDAQNAVSAKTLELLADGELSKADQQQIADLEAVAQIKRAAAMEAGNHADALREEAAAGRALATVWEDGGQRIKRMNQESEKAEKERTESLKKQGSLVSGLINGWNERLGKLSEAAEAAFRNTAQGGDYAAKAIAEVTDATSLLHIAQTNLAAGGFISWANRLAQQALEIELSFQGQAQAADRLAESLETVGEKGGVTAGAVATLVTQAESAQTSFALLDQARLDRLQNAIEGANDKLREMQEETQSAKDRLSELNADLLEAQGQDKKAELLRQQLDYQQSLAEIEKQRQEAELEGNQELVDILNQQQQVLESIHQTKVVSIVADVDTEQVTTGIDQIAVATERVGDALTDAVVVDLTKTQEQVDQKLQAIEQIADATQQLTDIVHAAAQERLAIETEHLEALDQLQEQADTDRLAQIKQNAADQLDAQAEYGQARKDQEQDTDDAIRTAREEHQQALLDLEKDYQAAVLEEQADLTQEVKDENKKAAKAVETLYEDSAKSIQDLNKEVAKDLKAVTKDLTKDLQAITEDLTKDLADASTALDRDFFKADRDSVRKIAEVYDDLGQAIIDRQTETQRDLLELEKDQAKDLEELYVQLADKTTDATADYQTKLADLSRDLSDSLTESNQELAQAVQDEHQKLAKSILDLNEDTADKLQDLVRDTDRSIADEVADTTRSIEKVTMDTTQDLADLAKDVQKNIQDTNDDLAKALVEVNEDAAQSVLELNADTAQSIEALYADSRDAVANIQQDFVDNTQALRDQLSQDALDATQSLADQSEAMRRTLLGEQGEQGQVLDAEFGDELQALAKLYAESGESAKDSFVVAVDQAKELYALQLEEMLQSGELSAQQAAAAQASMEERLALTDELVAQQKALLANEQNAQLTALSAARDQLLADQQATLEAQQQQIAEEAALQSAAIQQEKNEKIAAAQEEHAEKLRLIEEERLEKAQSISEEAELKKQEIQAESLLTQQALREKAILRQQDIEVEAEQRRVAFAKDTVERQADLQVEFAERQAKLNEEAAKKRADQDEDHQRKLADLQVELERKLLANAIDFADKQQKALDEEALKIGDDQQKAARKEADLIEDLAYKKQLLQEEYALELIELQRLSAEKRAEREQEAIEKKVEIAEEQAEKLQAIKDEAEEKKAQRAEELQATLADLEIASQARLAKLQEEYRLSQDAEKQASTDIIATLNRESEEKLVVLSNEFQEKRRLLQDEQAFALRAINETYQAELLLLNQKTQAELAEAKKKANQSVLLAQENIQSIEQQVTFELALARAKDAQAESQVRLNTTMKETLTLTKSISEQMGALASSDLAGLSQQAFALKQTLNDIEAVL